MPAQKKTAYFMIVGAVGGLMIGLVAGANIPPILAGVFGAFVTFSILVGVSIMSGNEFGGE